MCLDAWRKVAGRAIVNRGLDDAELLLDRGERRREVELEPFTQFSQSRHGVQARRHELINTTAELRELAAQLVQGPVRVGELFLAADVQLELEALDARAVARLALDQLLPWSRRSSVSRPGERDDPWCRS